LKSHFYFGKPLFGTTFRFFRFYSFVFFSPNCQSSKNVFFAICNGSIRKTSALTSFNVIIAFDSFLGSISPTFYMRFCANILLPKEVQT
jgi:hypothetical protein